MPFDIPPQQGFRRHEQHIPQVEDGFVTSVEHGSDHAAAEHIANAMQRYLRELIQAGDFKRLDEVPGRFLTNLQRMYQHCERDASRYRALTAPLVGMIVNENAVYLNDTFDEDSVTDFERYERYRHQTTVQDFLDVLSSPELLRFRTMDGALKPVAAQPEQEFGQMRATVPLVTPPRAPLEYASSHTRDALERASTWMAHQRAKGPVGSRPTARVAPETGDGYSLSGTDYDVTSGFLTPGALHQLDVGRWPYPNPQTVARAKRSEGLFNGVLQRFWPRPPGGRDERVDW